MSTIGTMFDASNIEDAIEATVRLWQETYLAQLERDTGRSPRALPKFRSYVKSTEQRKYDEDQVPALIIVATNTNGNPERRGQSYSAWFEVGVGLIVEGREREATLKLAKGYGAMLRTLLIQQSSWGEVIDDLTWVSEEYDDGGSNGRREFGTGVITFMAYKDGILDSAGGPATPPSDPYATLPGDVEITEVEVEVERDES